MSQRAGGEDLVRPSGDPQGEPGSDLLLGLVVCTFLAGLLTGLILSRLLALGREIVSQWITRFESRPNPWTRLTIKLLNFIRKRRLVGIAFQNYQNYSLHNQPGSKPTQLRKRRVEPPAPIRPKALVGRSGIAIRRPWIQQQRNLMPWSLWTMWELGLEPLEAYKMRSYVHWAPLQKRHCGHRPRGLGCSCGDHQTARHLALPTSRPRSEPDREIPSGNLPQGHPFATWNQAGPPRGPRHPNCKGDSNTSELGQSARWYIITGDRIAHSKT